MSRYISIKKTAEILNVSDKTIRRKIISNKDILNKGVDKPIVQAKRNGKNISYSILEEFILSRVDKSNVQLDKLIVQLKNTVIDSKNSLKDANRVDKPPVHPKETNVQAENPLLDSKKEKNNNRVDKPFVQANEKTQRADLKEDFINHLKEENNYLKRQIDNLSVANQSLINQNENSQKLIANLQLEKSNLLEFKSSEEQPKKDSENTDYFSWILFLIVMVICIYFIYYYLT